MTTHANRGIMYHRTQQNQPVPQQGHNCPVERNIVEACFKEKKITHSRPAPLTPSPVPCQREPNAKYNHKSSLPVSPFKLPPPESCGHLVRFDHCFPWTQWQGRTTHPQRHRMVRTDFHQTERKVGCHRLRKANYHFGRQWRVAFAL